MKSRHASLLVALLAVGACKKSQPDAPAVAPVAPVTKLGSADPWSKPAAKLDPLPRPLFWTVEKDGKTTYLFGTMHMGVDPETRVPKLVWAKLDAAPTFAMETDLSDASKVDFFRQDGSTLHKELGDPYWKKLETAIGAELAKQLDGMKPMVVVALLSTRGLPETPPMDGVLSGRAINEHKPMVYLERAETQTALLDKWLDARSLKETLDDLAGGEQRSKEMLDAYIAGDDTKILAINDAERDEYKRHGHSEAEYDQQMDELLFKRNASWIAPIEKLHAAGGGFIAVGAMHLIGKRSVLDLLQQKGYKVTRLTP